MTNKWSGGDSFIIYPGKKNTNVPSIRLAAMRDGINDYKLLESVARIDPAQAQRFVDQLIQKIDQYNMDIPHFRTLRKEMLTYLEQARQ